MRSPKRFKRPTALILAVLLLIVFMDHSSFAENTVNLISLQIKSQAKF